MPSLACSSESCVASSSSDVRISSGPSTNPGGSGPGLRRSGATPSPSWFSSACNYNSIASQVLIMLTLQVRYMYPYCTYYIHTVLRSYLAPQGKSTRYYLVNCKSPLPPRQHPYADRLFPMVMLRTVRSPVVLKPPPQTGARGRVSFEKAGTSMSYHRGIGMEFPDRALAAPFSYKFSKLASLPVTIFLDLFEHQGSACFVLLVPMQIGFESATKFAKLTGVWTETKFGKSIERASPKVTSIIDILHALVFSKFVWSG